MKKQINNVVVKNQTPETGKRIIELFKQLGVDTMGYQGDDTGNEANYGVINTYFGCHSTISVKRHYAQIFESVEEFENSKYFKSKTESKMSDLADFTPATIDNVQEGQQVFVKLTVKGFTDSEDFPISTDKFYFTKEGKYSLNDTEPSLFIHTPQQKEFTPYWAMVSDRPITEENKGVKRKVIFEREKDYIVSAYRNIKKFYAYQYATPINPEIEALEAEIEADKKAFEAKQNRLAELNFKSELKVKRLVLAHVKDRFVCNAESSDDLIIWNYATPINPEIEALEDEIEAVQKELEAKQNRLAELKAKEIEVNK